MGASMPPNDPKIEPVSNPDVDSGSSGLAGECDVHRWKDHIETRESG